MMQEQKNEVQLYEMLEAREQRANQQKLLLARYHCPVICFMLNIPGPVKVCAQWEKVFVRGMEQIMKMLEEQQIPVLYSQSIRPKTGYELYVVADCEAQRLKKLCCAIEDGSELGRLYDVDVIGTDGYKKSRGFMGIPPRKCLLCGREAHVCARSRRHSVEELIQRIGQIIAEQLGE